MNGTGKKNEIVKIIGLSREQRKAITRDIFQTAMVLYDR